jgi:hypothetical protein
MSVNECNRNANHAPKGPPLPDPVFRQPAGVRKKPMISARSMGPERENSDIIELHQTLERTSPLRGIRRKTFASPAFLRPRGPTGKIRPPASQWVFMARKPQPFKFVPLRTEVEQKHDPRGTHSVPGVRQCRKKNRGSSAKPTELAEKTGKVRSGPPGVAGLPERLVPASFGKERGTMCGFPGIPPTPETLYPELKGGREVRLRLFASMRLLQKDGFVVRQAHHKRENTLIPTIARSP